MQPPLLLQRTVRTWFTHAAELRSARAKLRRFELKHRVVLAYAGWVSVHAGTMRRHADNTAVATELYEKRLTRVAMRDWRCGTAELRRGRRCLMTASTAWEAKLPNAV